MANYLVTGAAGFIGQRVSELLMADGHVVFGLDNLNDAYDVRVKLWRLNQLKQNDLFHFQQLDISEYEDLRDWIHQLENPIDAIINLAARAGVRQSVENPWVYVNTNVVGNLNLLEIARHLKIKKYILASTSSLYGENPPLPTPESAESDHPLQPYAASKKGAEALCHSYHYLYGIDTTVFRYFTVYGPAGRPDMVMFRLAKWIAEGHPVYVTGDGNQARGFTYIDDIARGTILGLKKLNYELINLGGHEVITINELVRIMEDKIGKKANIQYIDQHKADVMQNCANVEKAKQMLSWEPQVNLDQGIANLVNWYFQERNWVSQVATP
ncbi:MAG: nucleotide sugar epimerase [Chloroflexi bacterium HGW-Chloroflexi-2]|jgi:nucleoside-diphosphate-sugar epimerase|nr:MAG: nucleotide sugar epimerase [Chloroflexi bacterium HGW-Chloroflexi-2]